MRVLFLSPDFPIPAKTGLKVRVLSQLKLLHALDEIESISFLSVCPEEVAEERRLALETALPKLRTEQPAIRALSIRQSAATLARFCIRRLVHNEPYIVAINACPELSGVLERLLRANRYDIIYIGYLGMMGYVGLVRALAPNALVVLEQHNLEWHIFERLSSTLRMPFRQLVHLEALALRKFEQAAMRQVGSVIAISDDDATQFRSLSEIDAYVVPPFIEARVRPSQNATDPHIAYIGHLGWQPNVLGLDWFCKEVWPSLLQQVENVKLTIAGPGLGRDSLGRLLVPKQWQLPGITTVGFVDDLNDLYAKSAICIAPIVGGSGVRMKILETMSAGMPTVTTSDGAAGLSVTSGKELLIADDPSDFARCIVLALRDGNLRDTLRSNAYAYLESTHSQSVALAQLRRSLTRD